MINTTGQERAGHAGNLGVTLAIVFLLLVQLMFATVARGDDAELSVESSHVSAASSAANSAAPYVKSPMAGVPKSAPATGRYLVSLTLGLLAIVGLIFALAWLVKRMGQGSFVNNTHLKILAVMPLGTRERLVIVQAGEQQLLLGITASQINTLHVFPEPVIQPEAQTPSDFGKKMLAILQKNNHSPSASDQRRTVALDDPEQP
jgi:flagellar protein FliO/FliZ